MALRRLSTTALRAELARRERGATKLVAQRAKLAKQIAALDAELASLGAAAPARRGRPVGSKNKRRKAARPGRKLVRNKASLSDTLAAAVKPGRTVTVPEATKAVLAAGYKTADRNFGQTIARTLAAHKGFKRKGRGTYVRVGGIKPTTSKKAKRPAKRKAAKKPVKRAVRKKSIRKAATKPTKAKRPARRKPAPKATAKPAAAVQAVAAAA